MAVKRFKRFVVPLSIWSYRFRLVYGPLSFASEPERAQLRGGSRCKSRSRYHGDPVQTRARERASERERERERESVGSTA